MPPVKPFIEIFWIIEKPHILRSDNIVEISCTIDSLKNYCKQNDISLSDIKMRMQTMVKTEASMILWSHLDKIPICISYNLN